MNDMTLQQMAAPEYWRLAKAAEEGADRATDLDAKRTWREVASHWRKLAILAERNQQT